MRKIVIRVNDLALEAALNDSNTADRIWDSLPFKGLANVWGDEIYFEIPLEEPEAIDARVEVEVGALGYWPAGRAFCVFYGPTPVSVDERPRAYSPVNIFGQVTGDATRLRGVKDRAPVVVEKSV
jgi:hypothetical protein